MPATNQNYLFEDISGFQIVANENTGTLRIVNPSGYNYFITPDWQELQAALRHSTAIIPGIYLTENPPSLNGSATCPLFFQVSEHSQITSKLNIPPHTERKYVSVSKLRPEHHQTLFNDGKLVIVRINEKTLIVINQTDHEYNVQPMWDDVRKALGVMPHGFYHDNQYPDMDLRTMIIGDNGLESRVKSPPRSSLIFSYSCSLSNIDRIALIPLGHRCAVRMLLYKMEYDGPCYPFDLTRTTNLGDIADMINSGFDDMWNSQFLYYSKEDNRVYHTKWTGLSFGHEVEEWDDPLNDMTPVFQRMRRRYLARAERFWHTLNHCDQALFIRTGESERGQVMDLVEKLKARLQDKPFNVLLLSLQSSEKFHNIPNVIHRQLDFNPDQMYENHDYWWHCSGIMRDVLNSLGVSSKNLFWCPGQLPENYPGDPSCMPGRC